MGIRLIVPPRRSGACCARLSRRRQSDGPENFSLAL